MAEDLTEYFHENGLKVRYMHSDIDTLERIEIIRDLTLSDSARSRLNLSIDELLSEREAVKDLL